MQIIHRISIASSGDIQQELAGLGIVVAERGFVSFEVDESHEAWPRLADWIVRRAALDIISTKFSKKELAGAQWLELMADWHHGYPQPNEDAFGYRSVTYDLTDWCSECGVGMKQKAPFQMKEEPKWGKNAILQLNWVFDEFFVTRDVWTRIFKPQGIGCQPVTNTKGVELKSVVQLAVQEDVSIVSKGLSYATCAKCTRTKYLPIARGAFPVLVQEPTHAIAKTKEYFGSGGRAYKSVLVSQKLAHSVTVSKVRGATARPVQSKGQ